MMERVPSLNALCPYFTMFPFAFPDAVIREYAPEKSAVLDPFCGRGTSNLASRLSGFASVGIDSNPVAVAIAEAKLVYAEPQAIVDCATDILSNTDEPYSLPQGGFWEWAFSKDVLKQLCILREELLRDCRSSERVALRAIVLGALHGPRNKRKPSYFSNQSQRTFAPKPSYAVRFWQARNLYPQSVDVIDIIARRAHRYYGDPLPIVDGKVILGDSRKAATFAEIEPNIALVITSPPYYGMRTYVPDQWLRWWFLGGPESVDYSNHGQLGHASPSAFANELRSVWNQVANVARPNCRMVIRFGAINDRRVDPKELILESLQATPWTKKSVETAGYASQGKRQANHFTKRVRTAIEEIDVVAELA